MKQNTKYHWKLINKFSNEVIKESFGFNTPKQCESHYYKCLELGVIDYHPEGLLRIYKGANL